MVVIEDMVGRQCLQELGKTDMRIEEVFEILPARSRCQTLFLRHYALVVYIAGSEQVWESVVCGQIPGFSCTDGRFHGVLAVGVPRAFEVVMLKMILPVSRGLRDVS
jgi:hypothetical protein